MKKYELSRGWRNNNPLNIRKGERWQDMRPSQNDPSFCQFENQAWGYRAGAKVLTSYFRYMTQKGVAFSPENIVRRWAPPKENKTERYIERVTELTGFERQQHLLPPNTPKGARQMALLMAAMTCVECGCEWQDVNLYNLCLGIWMAVHVAVDYEEVKKCHTD